MTYFPLVELFVYLFGKEAKIHHKTRFHSIPYLEKNLYTFHSWDFKKGLNKSTKICVF